MYATWQPVDLGTPWGDFAPGAVLFYTDETAVVVDARRVDKKVKVKVQRLDGERFEQDVKKRAAVGSLAHSLLPGGEVRAMALPAVIWQEDKLTSPRNVFALLVTAAVTTILLVLTSLGSSAGSFVYLAFMAGGAAGVYARRLWKGGQVGFMAPDRLGLSMATIHPYALTREQGRLWVSPVPGADRRGLAYQRVEAIRDSYLALRGDIAYRIETSALFDPKVPATAEFEAALVAFEDVTDLTPTDELDARATEVEVAFNVAQANAERLGLTHLPEDARSDARRAGKAARLAAGAATEGERQASLAQVRRILDSLALYYLPTIHDAQAIESGEAQRIVVVGAVIVRDGLVLAAQRSEGRALPGKWEFPGGKVEPGESPEESLKREVLEELGCHIEVGAQLERTGHRYSFGLVDLTTYWCTLLDGEPTTTEHAALLWADPDQLRALDWAPADVPAVERILATADP